MEYCLAGMAVTSVGGVITLIEIMKFDGERCTALDRKWSSAELLYLTD